MSKPSILNAGEFLLHETEDGQYRIDVRVDGDSVWSSLKQLTDLFGRHKSMISCHLKNVFGEGDLVGNSVVAEFATTAVDGVSCRHALREGPNRVEWHVAGAPQEAKALTTLREKGRAK